MKISDDRRQLIKCLLIIAGWIAAPEKMGHKNSEPEDEKVWKSLEDLLKFNLAANKQWSDR